MRKTRRIKKVRKEVKTEEKILEQSFTLMEKNKILFVPLIIGYAFTLLLVIAYFASIGFLDKLLQSSSVLFSTETLKAAIIGDSPLRFAIITIIYIAIELCIAAYFMAMDYGMIRDIIKKGKTNFNRSIKFANKHFYDVVGIYILSAFLVLIPLGILLFILIYFFNEFAIPGNVFLPAFFAFGFIILIFVSLRLLFLIPTMSLKNEGALKSVTDDFHYVKTHFNKVLISWFFVFTLILVYGLIRVPLTALHPLAENVHLFIAILVFIILLDTVVWIWEHILVFKVYSK